MKKNLVACGLAALLTVGSYASMQPVFLSHVAAATEVNFDQAGMSDEEYVKSIIDQFMDLDLIHIEMEAEEGSDYTYSADIDLKNMSMKTVSSGEYGGTSYSFDDGSSAMDTKSEIKMMQSIYVDNKEEILEIADEIKGKYILNEYPELKGQISKTVEAYKEIPGKVESYENKDGVIIATGPKEKISENDESGQLAEIYGDNATIQTNLYIDPKAETVVVESIIDVDESQMEETTESEELGISLSSMVADSTSKILMTVGTVSVPKKEDLDIITKEEIDALLEEKGIEVLF